MARYVYLCRDMGENSKRETVFRFKQFEIKNNCAAMKVGTDGVLIGAWADVSGVGTVLDVGAGTGLIGLMVAQRAPGALITGVELDAAASEEARFNADMSPWSGRISIINCDFLEYKPSGKFDLIVSNPPFFGTELKSPDKMRAIARHGDTLNVGALIRHSAAMLSQCGRLCFISPADRKDDILMEAAFSGLNLSRQVDVYTKQSATMPTRVLWEFTLSDAVCEFSELRINTVVYRELVSPYYLDK